MAFFENFWKCSACGRDGISALRQLKCPSCGHTKAPQDEERRSNKEIVDPDGLELAEGGPHWTCSYCGSVNLDRYQSCQSCGHAKGEGDETNRIIELGSTPLPAYTPPADPYTSFQRPEPAEETDSPYQRNDSTYAPISDRTHRPVYSYGGGGATPISVWPWIIGLIVFLVLAGLGWMVFHTTEMSGEVTGFSWSRDVTIQRYQTEHDSGWSRPAGAYNVRTSQRIARYDPIYQTRTETVRHQKTCYRDRGNGSTQSYDCSYTTTETKQVKVGERPVYQTWYEYEIDRWSYNRTAHSEGQDREPFWQEYILNRDGQTVIGAERVGGRSEEYIVHFKCVENDEVKNYTCRAANQEEWLEYQKGTFYPLKINSFGGIRNNPIRDMKEGGK